MCSRRGNSPLLQALFLVALIGSVVYCFLLYNSTVLQLDQSRQQNERSTRQRESLAAQLQVVYEHRARLEKSLQREKNDHKNTQQEQITDRQNFLVNMSRTKHEHMNRFNSLDTNHKMLKAQHDQLQTEYNRLQQQHARLSSEHTTLTERLSQNLRALRIQKQNEISGLEAQIETLQQQTEVLRQRAKQYMSSSNQYKEMYARVLKDNEVKKKAVAALEEDLADHKELLKKHIKDKEASQKKTEKQQAKDTNTIRTQQAEKQPVTLKDGQRSDRSNAQNREGKSNEDEKRDKESRTADVHQSESARQSKTHNQTDEGRKGAKQGGSEVKSHSIDSRDDKSRRSESSRMQAQPDPAGEATRGLGQSDVDASKGREVKSHDVDTSPDEQYRRSQSNVMKAQSDTGDDTRVLGQSEMDIPLKDRGHQSVQVVKPSTQAPEQQEDNPTSTAEEQDVSDQNQGEERRRRDTHARQQEGEAGDSISQRRQFVEPDEDQKFLRDPEIYGRHIGDLQTNIDENDEENFEDALEVDKQAQPMGAAARRVDESYSKDDQNSRDEDDGTVNDEDKGEVLTHRNAGADSRDDEKVEEVVDDVNVDHVAGGGPMGARPIQGVSKDAARRKRTFKKVLL